MVVSSWRIDDYQVVRIAGSLTRRIRRLSRMNVVLDVGKSLGVIPTFTLSGTFSDGYGFHGYSN